MEFLKDVLGDELYQQFATAVNAHNGNEANKDNQIKIANLASGEYVGKGKFNGIQAQLEGKIAELQTANDLISELKNGTKDDADIQGQISNYENQVQHLQEQLAATKIKAAIKVALLSEKANDIDYLTFKLENKLKEDGKNLELDDNDNIKGWNEMISGLKTQFPTQFEFGAGNKKIEEHKLEKGEKDQTLSRSDILKMSYGQRNQLFNDNPDGYNAAMKEG